MSETDEGSYLAMDCAAVMLWWHEAASNQKSGPRKRLLLSSEQYTMAAQPGQVDGLCIHLTQANTSAAG